MVPAEEGQGSCGCIAVEDTTDRSFLMTSKKAGTTPRSLSCGMSGDLGDSGKFHAQESKARATMQEGHSNDGREGGCAGEEDIRGDRWDTGATAMDPPSVSLLQQRRDNAVKDFVQLDKSFHDNMMSGKVCRLRGGTARI